jgi:hypothetical protein
MLATESTRRVFDGEGRLMEVCLIPISLRPSISL